MKFESVFFYGFTVVFPIAILAILRPAECSKLGVNATSNNGSFYTYISDSLRNKNGKKFVTLGFLGSYGHTQVGLGALPLAIDAVNKDPNLLPGLELKYVAADIGTNPPSTETKSFAACAIEKMTEMRDSGSIAFIGPDDTCSSEALVAAAWNLPMISYTILPFKIVTHDSTTTEQYQVVFLYEYKLGHSTLEALPNIKRDFGDDSIDTRTVEAKDGFKYSVQKMRALKMNQEEDQRFLRPNDPVCICTRKPLCTVQLSTLS